MKTGVLASRRIAFAMLAAAMAASAALIWTWSQGETLLGDEWGYALRIATEPASTYLVDPPPGKHLIAVPLLFYKAAFEIWGISSDAPYQVAHIVLLLLCAGLFFLLARRRVGDVLAVLATAVLLFLGPAWEVVATPLRMPSLISTAAGLGMLLMLERRDLVGDLGACLLLAVSLASLSTGYAFAAAAVVLVLARPAPERWRRAWVCAVPIALYAAWWVVAFDPGPNSAPIGETLIDLPIYLGKSLAVTVLSVTGLVQTGSTGKLLVPSALYAIVAAGLVGALVWALVARLRRPEPISPFLVAIAAALVTFWVATAFAPGPARFPWAPRYLYLDAVLFLLGVCELARGLDVPRRLTRAAWGVIGLVFVVVIAGNVRELHHQAEQLVEKSSYIRAGITSLQMAGDNAEPTFRLDVVLATVSPTRTNLLGDESENNGLPLGPLTAHGFASVIHRYGSPAYSPAELPSLPPGVRMAADTVLVRALDLRLRPVTARATETDRSDCREVPASLDQSTAMVRVAAPSVDIEAGRRPLNVTLGRFADGTPVPLGAVRKGSAAELDFPSDAPGERSPVAWRLGIAGASGATVCGVNGPGIG